MKTAPVQVQIETMTIPTYPESRCEELPMFAENRVHQRSSGNPYPNKVVIQTRENEKIDRPYTAIRLENEYLELILLPELGGRIFSARDKVNDYDFFYRQHVIKPALIGSLGSWISGGVEFNWPYHHRPSTFLPTDYEIEKEADGSVTVWMSEHDPADRMKGTAGIRLSPGRAMLETRVRLSNRTPLRHSFLWWENAAVPVNPEYELFFPQDVHHVRYHYRRSNMTFPIARGLFNGFLYDENGVDIRWHKNSKESTSYFCAASDYDFFGGYDNGRNCGVVHVADHHVSPGRKMFTWAYNQLAASWERMLTDTDGAYAELMAGSYSDNQPDFAWLEPYETKCFSQYWYPLAGTGALTYADTEYALHIGENVLRIQSTTDRRAVPVRLTSRGTTVYEGTADLPAGHAAAIALPAFDLQSYEITVGDSLYYAAAPEQEIKEPELFCEVPMPREMPTAEARYLAGLHLMQYRDPKAEPDEYFRAALEIDPEFTPALTALGERACLRGDFEEAHGWLEKSAAVRFRYQSNADSGRTLYLLGYACEMLGRDKDAYDCYRRAAWNADSIGAAMTRAALLDLKNGRPHSALRCAQTAVEAGAKNPLAPVLAAYAADALGQREDACSRVRTLLASDPLNHAARWAAVHLGMMTEETFFSAMHSDPSQTCLDLACDLWAAGRTDSAHRLLSSLIRFAGTAAPTVAYAVGQPERADYAHRTFPFRPEERAILQAQDSDDARYLLACLHYAMHRREEAYALWNSLDRWDARRNCAVVLWHRGEKAAAIEQLRRALRENPDSSQMIWELAYLLNHTGADAAQTAAEIARLAKTPEVARDDVVMEWATALTRAGQFDEALSVLSRHSFIPCEGGETALAKRYIGAWYGKGERSYREGRYEDALTAFRAAQQLPENLCAGLWHVVPLVPAQYAEALALSRLGRTAEADALFVQIRSIRLDFFSDMYLPAIPVYQAMAKRRLGENEAADAQLANAAARWQRERSRRDSGYFTQQPFFISYPDNASEERASFYDSLLSLAARAAAKETEIF